MKPLIQLKSRLETYIGLYIPDFEQYMVFHVDN
jgi:hypothetical protein